MATGSFISFVCRDLKIVKVDKAISNSSDKIKKIMDKIGDMEEDYEKPELKITSKILEKIIFYCEKTNYGSQMKLGTEWSVEFLNETPKTLVDLLEVCLV